MINVHNAQGLDLGFGTEEYLLAGMMALELELERPQHEFCDNAGHPLLPPDDIFATVANGHAFGADVPLNQYLITKMQPSPELFLSAIPSYRSTIDEQVPRHSSYTTATNPQIEEISTP